MSTTTIRLPDELKARVARQAESAGLTPHGFILQAIEAQTAEAEARADFHRVAQQRLEEMERTGLSIPWEEARQYLLDRAAGKNVPRPRPRKSRG